MDPVHMAGIDPQMPKLGFVPCLVEPDLRDGCFRIDFHPSLIRLRHGKGQEPVRRLQATRAVFFTIARGFPRTGNEAEADGSFAVPDIRYIA
jgi:hypothetical protein